MKDIYYQFPQAAFLLFGVFLLLGCYWYLFIFREERLNDFTAKKHWKELIRNRSPLYFWLKFLLFCCSWIFLILALMDPMDYGHYATDKRDKKISKRAVQEITLLIDASASMNVPDMIGKKTRFEVSKEIADELLTISQEDIISIYAFTNELIQLVPPTYDRLYARFMLRQLQINQDGSSGTNLLEAMQQIKKEYDFVSDTIPKVLILFTDGEDTQLETLPSDRQSQEVKVLFSAIEQITNEKVRLFVVGVGSTQGGIVPNVNFEGKPVNSQLEEKLLQEMSRVGQGKFVRPQTESARSIAKELAAEYQQVSMKQQSLIAQQELVHARYYQFPLAIAILFLTLKLLCPERKHSFLQDEQDRKRQDG